MERSTQVWVALLLVTGNGWQRMTFLMRKSEVRAPAFCRGGVLRLR